MGGLIEGPGHPPPGPSSFSRGGYAGADGPARLRSSRPAIDHERTHRADAQETCRHPAGPTDALATEEQLLREYAATRDENAREELVRRFLPFARSLAMRYSGGVEPSDDLIQVASLGLVSALERYDPERGVPFAAFAGPTILGELRRHFRDRVWTLRVPRGLQESIRAVEGAIAKLSHELERSPTVAEIAELLEVAESDVLEAFEATAPRGARCRSTSRRPARSPATRRRWPSGSATTTRASSWSRIARRSTPAPASSTRTSARCCGCASPRT